MLGYINKYYTLKKIDSIFFYLPQSFREENTYVVDL